MLVRLVWLKIDLVYPVVRILFYASFSFSLLVS